MTTVLTQTIARVLFLPALAVAAATLVKGYVDTGDGFAAGVIAALAVLLQVVVFGLDAVSRTLPLRAAPGLAALGLLISLTVTFVPALRGRPLLTHAPGPGQEVLHFGTVEILTAVAFDIGVFLLVLGFSVTTIRLLAGLANGRAR
jgi:multisubunit Na+/H+ antiporter MnhB subunit